MSSPYDFLNQYFDKILVLTLERATERHAKVRELLRDANYEFFYGVDKLNLDYDSMEKNNVYNDKLSKKSNHSPRSMSLGQVACSLSHRKMYEMMEQNNWKRILIFEDDVVPLKENLSKIQTAFQELPKDWDLVYLGYAKHEKITPKMRLKQKVYLPLSYLKLIKYNPKEVKNRLPKKVSDHINKAGEHLCTHAYAITKEGAKKLIQLQTPVIYNADLLLTKAIMNEKIKAYTFEPQFFAQEDFFKPSAVTYVRD